jgi:hypothetical protein
MPALRLVSRMLTSAPSAAFLRKTKFVYEVPDSTVTWHRRQYFVRHKLQAKLSMLSEHHIFGDEQASPLPIQPSHCRVCLLEKYMTGLFVFVLTDDNGT